LVRGVLALLLMAAGVSGQVSEVLSFGAVLAGLVVMATALTRECPLYRLMHTGTAGPQPAAPPVQRR
jgi:hypothetical protein